MITVMYPFIAENFDKSGENSLGFLPMDTFVQ